MKKITIEDLYQVYVLNPIIQTDTRKLKRNELFFALKGENFNGNLFVKEALEIGAAYAIVDEIPNIEDNRIILVDDVLVALQELAKYHRNQLNIPVIAITGSNGKTTTKELINEVLKTKFKTYTTEGNLNNHIGIPLTILKIRHDAEIAVVEMGANHQKEIEGYCKYTLPTHGLITNCGKAHLEGFGGVMGVRKGKGELFDFLRDTDGTAFVNWSLDYLHQKSEGINNVVKFASKDTSVSGGILASTPFLHLSIDGSKELAHVKTQLVGDYNFNNVLSAIAIGKYFNIPEPKIKYALENYSPTNNRSQLIENESNSIILDAYNANPTSMKAAIENFSKFSVDKKILLIGGMMELGEESIQEHQFIVDLINKYQWYYVGLIGGDFNKVIHTFHYFRNSVEAKEWYKKANIHDAHILIKGSRSMKMETILEA